jgi:hypothetical protein
MASTIQNRARHLLVLPLNGGGTLHLAPGETSSPVEDFELDNNEKVGRLLNDGLIAVSAAGGAQSSAGQGEGEVHHAAGGGRRRRGEG